MTSNWNAFRKCVMAITLLLAMTVFASATALAQADLEMSVPYTGVWSVFTNQNFWYTLNVYNKGPQASSGFVVTINLPTNVTLVSASGTFWTCSGTGPVSCLHGSLPKGYQTKTLLVTVQAPASYPATIQGVSASVTGNESDPDETNNERINNDIITVTNDVDLLLYVEGGGVISPNQSFLYSFNVRNRGPQQASWVDIEINLPANVTLVSASGTFWSCPSPTTDPVRCTYGSLPRGYQAKPLYINVRAISVCGSYTASATVSAPQPDPDLTNNEAYSAATTVSPCDAVAPTITAVLTKADGESYTPGTWSNQGLYVDYVCEDNPGGSGIAFDNYNAAVDWTFDEGADQSHTAAGSGCVDNAGNEADPLTLSEINVDSTAPDPTVAFRQVSASETHTADGGTMVSFSPQFVDDVGVVEESCDPASGSLFPTGLSLATCWATDPAGNTGTSSFEIFVRDDSPPVLTGSLVTPPYANRSTPVTISVTVTDNVGVALVSTWASFGPRLIGRDFSGYCTPGLETLPTTTTCTVTELIPPLSPEGEYAIWMTAEDAAVNVGTTEPTTHQLFVDFTKPTITAVLTKADGDSYIPGTWSNQSVNVDYVCADSPGGSGIATDDYAAAVDWTFDEGADQSHTAAGSGCVDLAGNEADPLIVDDIDVDLTPPNPTVAFKRVSASETHTADGGTAVSFSPEFVDDAGIVEESCDPASGSLFPTRLSVATCWATDPAGNTGTSSFEIFVRDDSPPVLTDSLVTPSYANRSTPVTISVTVTDNVGVALVSTWASFGPRLIGRDFSGYCTPGLETAPTSTTCTVTELIPPLSPEGEYAIWMTAEDAAVNVGTTEPTTHQLFVDFTKPTITAVLTKADGDSYIPGTWSNQSVNVDYICTDSPGGSGIDMDDYAAAVDWTFDEGADQSHTAAGSGCVDLAGNEADPLVVSDIDVDLTAPTIVQAPIRVSASATHTADDGTVVTFTPEVMDNEDVGLVASCEPASGTRFALGATGVNCEATDSAGNTGTHFFNVRVWDESPPVLTNSSVTPRYANASTLVTMTVTVTDNVGVDLVLVLGQVGELVIERNLSPFCNPSLDLTPTSTTCAATLMVPSQLPEGDYTLWMMAYDRGNNEGTTVPTSHMLFYDVTKPTITAVLTKADGESYTPGTWSNQSVNVDYVCADSPGGSGIAMDDYAAAVDWTFGEGADQSHTAAGSGCVDLAGNEADPLVVSDIDVDQTAPILTNIPQNQAVIESITGGGMVVDYPLPTAIDTVDLFPEVSCAPQSGSLFPLGDTPVTCTATDDSGNQALAGFVITVLTPAEAVIALLDHIEDSVGESSVAAPLKQIAKLLQDGNTTNDGAVCNKLTAFIGIVETKRDQGRLSDLEAQDLITSATEIMASVGCQMSGS